MSPLEINIAVIGLILTALGILVTVLSVFVQFVTGMFPLSYLEEKKKQKLLTEKFSRGPYDKATIERSTKYYVYPKCSNIDPAQEQEIRHALVATRESLFEKVDEFLDSTNDNTRRHLLVLADSGMGKTSFILNYYFHNTRRSIKKRHQLVIIPLGVKNPDELINQITSQEEKILFLDAFDEDVQAIKNHRERIIHLMDKCSQFKKIVITCRTQFFPKGEEIPVETGILKLGPRSAGDKGIYEFWKLYLSPFSDNDVKIYIKKRYPFWMHSQRKKALDIALKAPLLSVRPMLLAHIPEIISNPHKIEFSYQIYEIMITAWINRESKWVDKTGLRQFSQKLAVDFFVNREVRGSEGTPYSELSILAESWGIPLENWQLGGRSLLNRDAEDNFKFAHRSIMEYLFVDALLFGENATVGPTILTDQMKVFISEILGPPSLFKKLFDLLPDNQKYSLTTIEDNASLLSSNEGMNLINDRSYIPNAVKKLGFYEHSTLQQIKKMQFELNRSKIKESEYSLYLAKFKYLDNLIQNFPISPTPTLKISKFAELTSDYNESLDSFNSKRRRTAIQELFPQLKVIGLDETKLDEIFVSLIERISNVYAFNKMALNIYEQEHYLYPKVLVLPIESNYQELMIVISRKEFYRRFRNRQIFRIRQAQ